MSNARTRGQNEVDTWTISNPSGASGDSCVNRHNAKSISSIAVPEVNPRISRSSPGLLWSAEGDGELEVSESPLAFDCSASRYLCPTGVRTRPFGAGISPFMTITIADCQQGWTERGIIAARSPVSSPGCSRDVFFSLRRTYTSWL